MDIFGAMPQGTPLSNRRARKPNFTESEKKLLFSLLLPHLEVLEAPNQGKERGSSLRARIWEQITSQYNENLMSLTGFHVPRNINELRNFLHNYRKARGFSTLQFVREDDRKPDITAIGSLNGSDHGIMASDMQDSSCDNMSVALSPDQILGDDSENPGSVNQRPESYKLSHNNHLSLVLEALAGDESFMDVTLTAQGKSVKAHKSVLSAVSPYFKSVLKANPCQHPIIIMPRDITFEELKYIIIYIYRGEMTVPADDLSSLLKTAETLQISGLSPSENTNSSNNERAPPPEDLLRPSNASAPPTEHFSKSHPTTSGHKRSNTDKGPQVKRKKTTSNVPILPAPCPSTPSLTESDVVAEGGVSLSEVLMDEKDDDTTRALLDAPEKEETSDSGSQPGPSKSTDEKPAVQISPLSCPYCLETKESLDIIKEHITEEHPQKSFYFCSCNRIFKSSNSILKHKEICMKDSHK